MSNYLFLTENNNEGPSRYFAINPVIIETLNLSETYDQFGQTISHGDAGDSITLLTDKAVKIANDAYNEEFSAEESYDGYVNKYETGDFVSAYDFCECFDAVIEKSESGIDYEEDFTTVKGFTYWDGSNWKTITVEQNEYEPTHNVVDEDLTKELNQAIENKSFETKGFGCEVSRGGDYAIIESQWQGSWDIYELISASDYEYLQQGNSALPQI